MNEAKESGTPLVAEFARAFRLHEAGKLREARMRFGGLIVNRVHVLGAPGEKLPDPTKVAAQNGNGLGRDLFAGMRRNMLSAEEGAITWL